MKLILASKMTTTFCSQICLGSHLAALMRMFPASSKNHKTACFVIVIIISMLAVCMSPQYDSVSDFYLSHITCKVSR